MSRSDGGSRCEARRITAAYARRAASGVDERYSSFEPAHLFQLQGLERAVLQLLRQEGVRTLAGLRVLDVGCGDGGWLQGLVRYGAAPEHLVGVDMRRSVLPGRDCSTFMVASADALPFQDASFDVVCQLTMLSSVLDDGIRRHIVSELLRVLRGSGVILWYDFVVNPFNPDVRGIGRKELSALFPDAALRVRSVTLAPLLTRQLAGRSWLACAALDAIPLLRTHLVAVIRPPRSSAGETPPRRADASANVDA